MAQSHFFVEYDVRQPVHGFFRDNSKINTGAERVFSAGPQFNIKKTAIGTIFIGPRYFVNKHRRHGAGVELGWEAGGLEMAIQAILAANGFQGGEKEFFGGGRFVFGKTPKISFVLLAGRSNFKNAVFRFGFGVGI